MSNDITKINIGDYLHTEVGELIGKIEAIIKLPNTDKISVMVRDALFNVRFWEIFPIKDKEIN